MASFTRQRETSLFVCGLLPVASFNHSPPSTLELFRFLPTLKPPGRDIASCCSNPLDFPVITKVYPERKTTSHISLVKPVLIKYIVNVKL